MGRNNREDRCLLVERSGLLPFSLKHIPQWNALEIKTNGKNSPKIYHEFMDYMAQLPRKQQPDDYTYLIPTNELDGFMRKFGYITTMTQTIGSIKGTEIALLPTIDYEPKHLEEMKLEPYPFQKIGIAYLVSVQKGILGDEMGLGKTPQGIGAANELLKEGLVKKVLVIVPASLKYQWQNEIGKFTDYTAIVAEGTLVKRKKIYNTFAESDVEFLIAGYETVRNDIELFKELEFNCIIQDEAHKLKSRTTKLYKAIIQLDSEYKFALTGTPMQNRPDEIFALMSWIDPEVLGKITAFRKEHIVSGEKFGRRFMELGYKNLDAIREKISTKLLRRMKSEVAPDLPEMIFSTIRADMTGPQLKLYKAIDEDFKKLQLDIQDFYAAQTESDAVAGLKSKEEDKILGFMYMMQAVSDHPLLLAQGSSKMAKKYLPLIRECRTSPKLEELVEMLIPVVERGSKIVIFSQYTQMLQLIRQRIVKEFEQEPYMIYGAVPSKERQVQVSDFEVNPMRQLMLLSDAGNYGLNLQVADTLVNFDLPWNPAVLKQRAGRIHRINSTHEKVDIVNMITNDTIDEQIEKTLNLKEALGDGLIERSEEEKDIMKELLENL